MADISLQIKSVSPPGLVTTLAILFFLAFGIKAAVFPLFFWLPSSYHTPPAPVSAIFAGLLTKVGVYALIRVFTLIFVQEPLTTHMLILIVAGFTMVTRRAGRSGPERIPTHTVFSYCKPGRIYDHGPWSFYAPGSERLDFLHDSSHYRPRQTCFLSVVQPTT